MMFQASCEIGAFCWVEVSQPGEQLPCGHCNDFSKLHASQSLSCSAVVDSTGPSTTYTFSPFAPGLDLNRAG